MTSCKIYLCISRRYYCQLQNYKKIVEIIFPWPTSHQTSTVLHSMQNSSAYTAGKCLHILCRWLYPVLRFIDARGYHLLVKSCTFYWQNYWILNQTYPDWFVELLLMDTLQWSLNVGGYPFLHQMSKLVALTFW